jgi:hypothetical protein
MSDLETRIRATLQGDATRAPLVAEPPARLRQRVRRRQAGTGLLAAITGVALVTASFAGIRALSAPDIDGVPAEQRYEIFERTADVAGVTITSPSDWFLIDQAHQLSRDPEPGTTLPILQLSNFDPGLDEPLCGAELPSRGVALTIAMEPYAVELGPQDRRWPTELVDVESSDCGPGKVARFFASVGESSPSYFLWVGFGADVSDEDRNTVLRAVASLEVAPEKRSLYGDGPAYVVAGGEDRGAPWLLELSPSLANVRLWLVTLEGTTGLGSFTVPSIPIEGDAFGAVTEEAARVEFRPTDGSSPIAARIVPLPPSMPFDFDLFYFEDPFAVFPAEGFTVAVAEDGTVLDRESTVVSPNPPAEAPHEPPMPPDAVRVGTAWVDGVRHQLFAYRHQHQVHDLQGVCLQLGASLDCSYAPPPGSEPQLDVTELGDGKALLTGTLPPDAVAVEIRAQRNDGPPTVRAAGTIAGNAAFPELRFVMVPFETDRPRQVVVEDYDREGRSLFIVSPQGFTGRGT